MNTNGQTPLPFPQTEINPTAQLWIKVSESAPQLAIPNSYQHFPPGETEVLRTKAAGRSQTSSSENEKPEVQAHSPQLSPAAAKSLLEEFASVLTHAIYSGLCFNPCNAFWHVF